MERAPVRGARRWAVGRRGLAGADAERHHHAPMAARRALGRRRGLGVGLLAFGISGLVLVVLAAVLVLGSLAAVDTAASGFERQRAELVAMIDPAASALSDAATSAANAGASLTTASEASRRAADLTAGLATSFEGMAGLGSFDVFGARPFAGVASQFADVATQSRTLSTDLTATADTLAQNVADSTAVAVDLRNLADRLRRLEASTGASRSGAGHGRRRLEPAHRRGAAGAARAPGVARDPGDRQHLAGLAARAPAVHDSAAQGLTRSADQCILI
jgi:hypothetical protein